MFVRDVIFSSLKRWYFLLVGLLLTGAMTYVVFGMISPTYEAKASMVLIPPKIAVTVGDNPYLYLGGLDQALGVLQVKVASPSESAAVIDKYPGAEISIVKDATTSGPIIAIEVSANDAADTMALLNDAITLVPKTLADLQTELKVPRPSLISVMKLSADSEPTKISKKQMQMTMIVAVGGISASLLGTGFLDRMLNRRKTKRQAKLDASERVTPLTAVGENDINGRRPALAEAKKKPRRKNASMVEDLDKEDAPTADVGT